MQSVNSNPKMGKSKIKKKKNSFGDMVKTILVVDDEPDIRESVKLILEKEGYNVIIAVNADDCLKKVQGSKKIDLILLDIMMPGTPVREIISKIKNIKIAFLSIVRTSEAERENLLGEGTVVEFIQKPFDVKYLINKVGEIVK